MHEQSSQETHDDGQAAAEDAIWIRATAKRNGLTSVILGIAMLLLAILMFKLLPAQFSLLAIFTTSAGIVALLIGWFKIREPAHSMKITRDQVDYRHRKGNWCLQWQNVQRIDIPKISHGLEHKALSLVGIKVKDYDQILDSVSPRLMSFMLMEQRPLLLQSQDKNCASGTCYGDDLLEEDSYKSESGRTYKGIQAMFGNRMAKLRTRLGFDLFINSAELDRTPDEFVELLRACHQDVLRQ